MTLTLSSPVQIRTRTTPARIQHAHVAVHRAGVGSNQHAGVAARGRKKKGIRGAAEHDCTRRKRDVRHVGLSVWPPGAVATPSTAASAASGHRESLPWKYGTVERLLRTVQILNRLPQTKQ